jgi:hypothetical protein
MIILKIQGEHGEDEFILHSDIKKQMKLRHELLSRYPETSIVTITDRDGKELEKIQLKDLFGEKEYNKLKTNQNV